MSDFIEFNGYSLRKDAIVAIGPVELDDRSYEYFCFTVTLNNFTITSTDYLSREGASEIRSKLLHNLDPNNSL